MSKPSYGPAPSIGDGFGQFLESAAKLLVWVGLGATLIGLGFLIFTFSAFAGGTPPASVDQALSNIDLFQKALLAGIVALAVGTTYLYWGEETLGVFQLGVAAALYFSPFYLPGMLGASATSEVSQRALGGIQTTGMILGFVAVAVVVGDLLSRARLRMKVGAKAEQLKYGKGIKEERDIQNVFMGKCWQLPFCRKFVRERCPIYHSKRTCWNERVGCMCEEQVIRDAMEGKVIPKDALAAAKFIPYNQKLSMEQKAERCRQCVIYNEHQKHKYKLWLPLTSLAFIAVYALCRGPLLVTMGTMIDGLDRMIGRATYSERGTTGQTLTHSGLPFQEILLVCFTVVVFAYALKFIEYLIFKLKV